MKYSRFTGKCNTLRHWSSLYPLRGQGLQVKANVANLFEMTITMKFNSFPGIVKFLLKDLPTNDYPVLNSRLFCSIWFTIAKQVKVGI